MKQRVQDADDNTFNELRKITEGRGWDGKGTGLIRI